MSFKILVSEVVAENGLDFLRQNGCEIKRGRGIDRKQIMEDLRDCDGLIVRIAPADAEILSQCPKLKVIGKHGVGVDTIDLDYCRKHGITVVNTPHANALSVAEYAIALMLACARQIPYKAREYKAGNYAIKDKCLGNEVSGKTLGLLGMGHIGTLVGQIARNGFGMKVAGYDPFLPEEKTPDGFIRAKSQEELLRSADFVSLHLPATRDTIHSIGADAFARMKSTAFLINTARGAVVDEAALFKALINGEIAGAGLDVSDPEPSRPDNPLMKLDNVVMTPHCAGATYDSMRHMSEDVAHGIVDVLTGKEPTWKVC